MRKFNNSGIYTQKNFDEYWDKGFIIIKDLVDPELCEYSNVLARSIADKDFGQIMHLHKEDFLVAQSAEKISQMGSLHEKVMYYRKLKQISNHFNEFLKNPEIVQYLSWLYGRQMAGLLTNLFFKEPGTKYCKQAWQVHQDNNYTGNENGMYVTVNLTFNYMSQKNGGLRLYPGSHKLGVLEAEERVSYRESDGKPGNTITEKLPMDPVECELEKGDVLFMHGLCAHESSDNLSNDGRPLLSLGYMAMGEKFDPGFQSKRSITFLN